MDMITQQLIDRLGYAKPGASDAAIDAAEAALGVRLPPIYRTLMRQATSAEGTVGGTYVSFWPVAELQSFNEDYQLPQYLPALVGFATDGGGQCYAIDYRTTEEDPPIVRVPLGDLDEGSLVSLADNLDSWFRRLLGMGG